MKMVNRFIISMDLRLITAYRINRNYNKNNNKNKKKKRQLTLFHNDRNLCTIESRMRFGNFKYQRMFWCHINIFHGP